MSKPALLEVLTTEEKGTALPQSDTGTARLQSEFVRLAEQWRSETLAMSSLTDMVLHPAYYQIIGLGPVALPWILRELQQRGGHWFLALRAITRENPVSPQDRGKVKKMADAWLKWGETHGLLASAP
jgi:hypothetical protein